MKRDIGFFVESASNNYGDDGYVSKSFSAAYHRAMKNNINCNPSRIAVTFLQECNDSIDEYITFIYPITDYNFFISKSSNAFYNFMEYSESLIVADIRYDIYSTIRGIQSVIETYYDENVDFTEHDLVEYFNGF